jgi:hypothetical protein
MGQFFFKLKLPTYALRFDLKAYISLAETIILEHALRK